MRSFAMLRMTAQFCADINDRLVIKVGYNDNKFQINIDWTTA